MVSGVAQVTVVSGPEIVGQPQGQTGVVGGQVTFNVQVNGTQPMTYQWYKNGVAISGATTRFPAWTSRITRMRSSGTVSFSR